MHTEELNKLLETMDAQLWAKEFMRLHSGHVCGENERIDEGMMATWFSNAIMCGYDHSRLKQESKSSAFDDSAGALFIADFIAMAEANSRAKPVAASFTQPNDSDSKGFDNE